MNLSYFSVFFLVSCQTLVIGLPIFPKSKTYSRDDVLKRLLIQADGIEKVATAITPLKNNVQTKKKTDPTRLKDKAKIFMLNQKEKAHLKNEKQLIGIAFGGKARVSRDLFGNKKYRAVKAYTSPISDLEYVTHGK